MSIHPQRPRLTVVLLALIVGLLVTTAGLIIWVERAATSQAVADIEGRAFHVAALALATRVEALLSPAGPMLSEARALAGRGRLKIGNEAAAADYFAERLRYQPTLHRFYFVWQKNGRLAGASRQDVGAEIVPGAPQPGNDPRLQRGYRQAAADRVVWTGPYRLEDGTPGITASLAWQVPGEPDPRGVFGVDFRLADLSRALAAFAQGRTRVRAPQLAILTRQGQIVASAGVPRKGAGVSALPSMIQRVYADLATLPLERDQTYRVAAGGATWIATIGVYRVAPGLEWAVAGMVPEDEFLEVVNASLQRAALAGLGILGGALLIGLFISDRITRPLRMITADVERIGRFDLSATAMPRSFVREIDTVGVAVGRMKASLRSFGRYAPVELVREVVASGEEARLGGRLQEVSLFFSDIAGFTRISEQMPPPALVEHLGEYLDAMTRIIQDQQGVVDKFIGDGILAMFNAPLALAGHSAAACRAAIRAQTGLRILNADWARRGQPVMETRIGLHTGETIIGNIGTPERFEYTVIGDVVNLASRLEGLSKVYGTRILASEAMRAAAGAAFEWRTLDRVAVIGRQSGTLVSELLGERGSVEPHVLHARDLYERALSAYFNREFGAAASLFRQAGVVRPDDAAALLLAARAGVFLNDPPPGGWDGIYHAGSK